MTIFREIEATDARLLLDWRLKPRVSDLMLSIVRDDPEAQQNWISGMRDNPEAYHWIASLNGKDIGYCKINDIAGASADHGGYIGDDAYIMYHGPIFRDFLHAVFANFAFDYLVSSVVEGNAVLKIMKFLGYKPHPRKEPEAFPRDRRLKLHHFILERDAFFSSNKLLARHSAPEMRVDKWSHAANFIRKS